MHPSRFVQIALLVGALATVTSGRAQTAQEGKLIEATTVLERIMSDPERGIPIELLQQARGIAVIPGMIRGGFFFGGRRGRGVLSVRDETGAWSNPAFVTVTGGSIGWQVGAESMDVVLVFVGARALANARRGAFTLGGDLAATAGPTGRHTGAAVAFRSDVYAYVQSRGLFAGAAFEGARINVDDEANRAYYRFDARPLEAQRPTTPEAARRFLLALQGSAAAPGRPTAPRTEPSSSSSGEATLYPLGDP